MYKVKKHLAKWVYFWLGASWGEKEIAIHRFPAGVTEVATDCCRLKSRTRLVISSFRQFKQRLLTGSRLPRALNMEAIVGVFLLLVTISINMLNLLEGRKTLHTFEGPGSLTAASFNFHRYRSIFSLSLKLSCLKVHYQSK